MRTKTQNNFVYGELGRFPLQTNRIISVVRYWLNVTALDNRKCSNDMMLNDTIIYPNVNNWASRVQRILENLAFTIVWLNQGVGCPKAFLKGFSQRVRDNLM